MRNEGARCGYGYEMEGIVGTHPAGAEDGVQPSVRSSRLALHHPRPSKNRVIKLSFRIWEARGGSTNPMPAEQSGSSTSARRQKSHPKEWLVGGGEMGRLIRSMDWTQTPLGPIDSWPQSLRT